MMRTPARGYTLLELIVSIGLFSMVMLVVMGLYLALISHDRQARATNQLVANLSFGIESMIRNVRTGTHYTGGTTTVNCTVAGSGTNGTFTRLTFCDSQDQAMHYRLNSTGTIGQCSGSAVTTCSDATAIPLTDPRITITSLSFNVRGVGVTGANALVQPQVTVSVRGTMETDAGKTASFVIQTSGTQRLLDIP